MGFFRGQRTDLAFAARSGNTRHIAASQYAGDEHSSDRDIPAHCGPPVVSTDGDMQIASRKAGTSFVLHIWVSRAIVVRRMFEARATAGGRRNKAGF
jgi:hypothetical protein